MSHLTTLRTKMVEREYLIAALKDLGHACEVGEVKLHSFGRKSTADEIRVTTGHLGYDIYFRRTEKAYDLVARAGTPGLDRARLVADLTRRYAYHASVAKLEAQGFDLVEEEVAEDGRVHLVLRRAV